MESLDKQEILRSVDFGGRTAEDESADLADYFVETDSWQKVWSGSIDIVFAPKGGGKSAIYSMLDAREDTLFDRGIVLITCENPAGDSAFSSIKASPPTSEAEFINIWRLYLLMLTASELVKYGVQSEESRELIDALEGSGLHLDDSPRRTVMKRVREYIARVANPRSVEATTALDPASGAPIALSARVSFGEVSSSDEDRGIVHLDDLYGLANAALRDADLQVWLMLDRLDVAFVDSAELEANALRALFRVYALMAPLEHVHLKIFLRTDIWEQITTGGFREMSHITRDLEIRWNEASLLQMVVRRLLRSTQVVDAYQVDAELVVNDVQAQEELLAKVFPRQVDAGSRKQLTFGWCLSRTRDGNRVNAPRELIHLFGAVRDHQIERAETGESLPGGTQLFEAQSFKEALPDVSEVRLVRTLYSEYPDVRPWLEQLRGGRTHHSLESLAKAWAVDQDEGGRRISRLIDIGFFEPRGTRGERTLWVPFLYRSALELTQGSAEGMVDEPISDST